MTVPSRWEHAIGLAASVEGVLVLDKDGIGPWFNWKQAWAARDPAATHHCVLQDDVVLCPDFRATMERLRDVRPTAPISGFLPRKSTERAASLDVRWVRCRSFLWAQCVMLPVTMGNAFLHWAATVKEEPDWKRHDDTRLQAFFKACRQAVYVPVPHPVEHIGHAIGGSTMGHNFKVSTRVARPGCWRGSDVPLAGLDWQRLDALADTQA